MDEPISIKLTIGGRIYPLRISWKNEEQVRKSAKLINEKLEIYREKVSYRDEQDLLAFLALDYAINESKTEVKVNTKDSHLSDVLKDIEDLLKNP